MEIPPSPASRTPWDRWVAAAMFGLASLLAAGWTMRERQLATDQAESHEDLRQAMHRLQTLSSSTEQIRTAYLQRKTELDAARKKLEQASARPPDERSKSSLVAEEAKPGKSIVAVAEKLASAKLPAWAAIEKTEGAIRILPGVSLPSGNPGFVAFGSLAPTLATADPDWTLELIARAEPGNDAWEVAQERSDLLLRAAEKSLKGQSARLRLRLEVSKGPRMEWRLQPPELSAKPPPEPKAARK